MFTASIISATFMMYLRLLIIAAIFNIEVLKVIATPYIVFGLITLIISFVYYKKQQMKLQKLRQKIEILWSWELLLYLRFYLLLLCLLQIL